MRARARLLLVLLCLGCGGAPARGAAPPQDEEVFEESGSMGVLENPDEAPPFPEREIGGDELAADMMQLRAAATPRDAAAIYRSLAPSTVIVRSETTMGTGVIVGPGGLVLTNEHVVRNAENDSFRMRVTVELGRLGETGSMIPEGAQREAHVLKLDPDADLALLRIDEPPDDRRVVSLAPSDPTPGQTVTTCGHGNVGMVWAVRQCQVEATGRLEESYARIAAVCGNDSEQRACELLQERMGARGTVIQSSCSLAPGDSGGPLVDPQGNLVGLNVMTIQNARGQHANYHVHLREIREFLHQIPPEPLVVVPTPWIDAQRREVLDQDLDGRWDTLLLRRGDTLASLYDLDQDTPDTTLRALEARLENRGFDAEMAILTERGQRFVFFDTDGDAVLDQVLTLDDSQRVGAAHAILEDGGLREASVPEGPALRSNRVAPPLRARFDRIFNSHQSDVPQPMPALLRLGRVHDGDQDGQPDTLVARRQLVLALAIDVDQDTPDLTRARAEELVRTGALDAEFTAVVREPTLFTFYDRDADGEADVGLRAAPNTPVVVEVLSNGGAAPSLGTAELAGTLAVRGDWFGERAAAFERMMVAQAQDSWVATEADVSGLPDPVGHHRGEAEYTAHYTEDGWDGYVLRTARDGFVTSLIDIDRSSYRGRNRRYREDPTGAVRGGHFSAELGVISTRGAHWAFYDTDADGGWDLVLVDVRDGQRRVRNAFRRDGDRFVPAPDMIEGHLIRPSLFRRRHRARAGAFMRAYFIRELVEPEA